jgi:hypothetical protein
MSVFQLFSFSAFGLVLSAFQCFRFEECPLISDFSVSRLARALTCRAKGIIFKV